MRFRNLALACAATAMATPIPAPAQDSSPRVFEASGPWTADFGEDYCRLVLSLRSDADETTLAFERIQPGPAMRVLIIGDSVRSFRGADTIGYHFASSRDQRPSEKLSVFSSSRTPDDRRLTIVSFVSIGPAPEITQIFQRRTNAGDETTFALGSAAGEAGQSPGYDPEVERERAAAIDHLVFDRGLQRAVKFNTGPMNDVMAVLQTCTDDLLGSWGVDAERHTTLRQGPIPLAGPLIRPTTVPFDQLAGLAGGYNQVRVMVNDTGEATSCHIHFPTLDGELNAQICGQVLENARFDPARDAEGRTLGSYWLVPVAALLGDWSRQSD